MIPSIASFEHSDVRHLIMSETVDRDGIAYTFCGSTFDRSDGYAYVGIPTSAAWCRACADVAVSVARDVEPSSRFAPYPSQTPGAAESATSTARTTLTSSDDPEAPGSLATACEGTRRYGRRIATSLFWPAWLVISIVFLVLNVVAFVLNGHVPNAFGAAGSAFGILVSISMLRSS